MLVLGDKSDVARAAITAPMVHHGRVLGVISAQSYQPGVYTQDDLEVDIEQALKREDELTGSDSDNSELGNEYALITSDDELHEQLSTEIQAAQVEALGITPDDLFHVFRPHQPGELKFDPGYNNVDLHAAARSGLGHRSPCSAVTRRTR